MNQRAVDQKHKRTLVTFIGLSLVMGSTLLTTSGCSVYMAAKQPGQKDLSVLKEGTPRSHVIAELGAPVWSGEKNGNKVDMFAFTQGYSAGAKAGRAFFHGAADFFTLGLWEIIGTPVESVASGSDGSDISLRAWGIRPPSKRAERFRTTCRCGRNSGSTDLMMTDRFWHELIG